MSVRDRLTTWHGVLVVVFLANAASALQIVAPVDPIDVAIAAASGLFTALFFHLVLGTAWGGIVEYRDAGGRWGDTLLVAPFVVATLAAAAYASAVRWSSVAAAVVAAEWGFVLATGLIALVAQLVLGYRDSQPAR